MRVTYDDTVEHNLCAARQGVVSTASGGSSEGSGKCLFQDRFIFVSGSMPTCYSRNRASGVTRSQDVQTTSVQHRLASAYFGNDQISATVHPSRLWYTTEWNKGSQLLYAQNTCMLKITLFEECLA